MARVVSVFCAQFLFIFLLGAQQLNVVRDNYLGAAATSLALGVLGFHLTATIASVHHEGRGTPVWWSYVVAGPIGIVAAMFSHPYFGAIL